MKLQLERDIARELDWLISSHQKKGGNTIKRIDLDNWEWLLFLDVVVDLERAECALIERGFDKTRYYYKGIEVVQGN